MTRSPRWRKVGVLLALLASVSALLHPWDTGAPARLVAVGVAPVSVAVDPRTAHVFVANWGDNTVSVLDAAGGRVRRVVAVGHTPFAVAVDGRAARVFVLASNPGSVSVLATTNGDGRVHGAATAVQRRCPDGAYPGADGGSYPGTAGGAHPGADRGAAPGAPHAPHRRSRSLRSTRRSTSAPSVTARSYGRLWPRRVARLSTSGSAMLPSSSVGRVRSARSRGHRTRLTTPRAAGELRPTARGEEETMPATRMHAIVCTQYGPPETLTLQEVDTPAIGPDGVLVRVRAASVNPADYHNIRGGLVVRLVAGLRRPRQPIPGTDVAGVVEAVGQDVTAFRPGDAVFGGRRGALAEYVSGLERHFVPKPATVSFEQAAAVAVAGVTALQGLRDKGRLQPGQSVLINGAAGGVGTFAVQIATALGGHVTGVCSTRNVDLVRSLGAERVVDYTQEDFARSGHRYDLVLDLVANRSLADLRRVVKARGTLVLSGGGHARGHGGSGLRPLLLAARGLLLARFVSQDIAWFIANINTADLATLKELMEAGKLTPVIDRTYPLSQTAAALRYLQAGHACGKVVITV